MLAAMRAMPSYAVAWSPLSLPNLVAWYDASDTATITASGGAVSALADKGPNGYHLGQSNGSLKPVTGATTQNGLNVLDFSADALTITGLSISGFNAATFFVALKATTGGGNPRVLAFNGPTGDDWDTATGMSAVMQVGGSAWGSYYASSQRGNASFTTGQATQLVVQRDGGTYSIWKAGVAGTGATGLGTTNFDWRRMDLGNYQGLNSGIAGSVFEVAVCSSATGSSDRAAWDSYIAAKWGL